MQLGGRAPHGCAKNGNGKVGARVDRVGGRLATRGRNARRAAAAAGADEVRPIPRLTNTISVTLDTSQALSGSLKELAS